MLTTQNSNKEPMTTDKKERIKVVLARLEKWADTQGQLEKQTEAFRALTGAMPDCDLLMPVFKMADNYTSAVGELVGDENEWMAWYQYECNMGKTPMRVYSVSGRETTIRTLRQLAKLICS